MSLSFINNFSNAVYSQANWQQTKHILIGRHNVFEQNHLTVSVNHSVSLHNIQTHVTYFSPDLAWLSVDGQSQQSLPLDCFLRPSASEWSSQTRSRTDDRVSETEYETTGAGTCSQQPPQNAGLGSSWGTWQTLPENPAQASEHVTTCYELRRVIIHLLLWQQKNHHIITTTTITTFV